MAILSPFHLACWWRPSPPRLPCETGRLVFFLVFLRSIVGWKDPSRGRPSVANVVVVFLFCYCAVRVSKRFFFLCFSRFCWFLPSLLRPFLPGLSGLLVSWPRRALTTTPVRADALRAFWGCVNLLKQRGAPRLFGDGSAMPNQRLAHGFCPLACARMPPPARLWSFRGRIRKACAGCVLRHCRR